MKEGADPLTEADLLGIHQKLLRQFRVPDDHPSLVVNHGRFHDIVEAANNMEDPLKRALFLIRSVGNGKGTSEHESKPFLTGVAAMALIMASSVMVRAGFAPIIINNENLKPYREACHAGDDLLLAEVLKRAYIEAYAPILAAKDEEALDPSKAPMESQDQDKLAPVSPKL